MSLPDLLALGVIVIAVPLNWLVVLRLWLLHRAAPHLRVLRERGIVATAIALVVTGFGAVFLNNGLEEPLLSPFATMVLTRSAILALTLPALYWLFLYRNGRRD